LWPQVSRFLLQVIWSLTFSLSQIDLRGRKFGHMATHLNHLLLKVLLLHGLYYLGMLELFLSLPYKRFVCQWDAAALTSEQTLKR
jgi:hypothetical protein